MLLSNLFVSVMNGSFCLTINTCALRNLILGNCIHLFGLRSRHYFMSATGITIVVAMYLCIGLSRIISTCQQRVFRPIVNATFEHDKIEYQNIRKHRFQRCVDE